MNLTKLILVSLFALLLSEAVFTLHTAFYHPEVAMLFFANRASSYSRYEDSNKTVNSLIAAAQSSIFYNHFRISNGLPLYYYPKVLFNDINISKLVAEQINNLEVNNQGLSDNKLAKIYYNFALIFNDGGDKVASEKFFKLAIYTDPQLSSYHVELANFYLLNNQIDYSIQTLKFCENFEYSKIHCEQYRINNFDQNISENVGFLRNEINKHYSEKN